MCLKNDLISPRLSLFLGACGAIFLKNILIILALSSEHVLATVTKSTIYAYFNPKMPDITSGKLWPCNVKKL